MEGDGGKTVIVTGRDYVDKIMDSGKFPYLVRVSWRYNALPDGMPEEGESLLMEQATDALLAAFKKDRVAVMTGIYTGDGRREWVFYTFSTDTFGKYLNRVLAPFPLLPLEISAENDPDWEEYEEMKAASEIMPGD